MKNYEIREQLKATVALKDRALEYEKQDEDKEAPRFEVKFQMNKGDHCLVTITGSANVTGVQLYIREVTRRATPREGEVSLPIFVRDDPVGHTVWVPFAHQVVFQANETNEMVFQLYGKKDDGGLGGLVHFRGVTMTAMAFS